MTGASTTTFLGAYEMDLQRFSPVHQIAAWMTQTGFVDIRNSVVERILNHQHGRAVLNRLLY